MALEGLAAIHARIAEIEGLGAGAPTTPPIAPSSNDTATSFATALNAAQTTGSGSTQQFLSAALAQRGKPYVWGANAPINDPNPKAFDCSELTKWAAAQAGVSIPDGAAPQYVYLRDHGTLMSVDQALHTPGALLFHFDREPRRAGDFQPHDHVAISLGDGVHTIEAKGSKYGTGVFEAGTHFNYAGVIPGLS
ncbi:MAG TPA: NlpC/P60 family protein [Acidimicrobiia bacterium]|nr:NlpC/P60 family protein [Acidimicrobiia bacterium]